MGNSMPKLKTHRGAAKRLSATGTGKIKRNKAFCQHIMTSKSPKRKRNMRHSGLVAAVDVAAVKKMLPYM